MVEPDRKRVLQYQPPTKPPRDWQLRSYRQITSIFLLSATGILAIVALVWPHHPALWATVAALALCGVVARYAS